MFSKLGVGAKLAGLLLLFGLPPAATIAYVAYNATNSVEHENLLTLEGEASHLADKIDRNLFERYGDVQAFGHNQVVFDQASWYQRSPANNAIARVMDDYMVNYGFYYLSILVDTSGKVIAVNSKDSSGDAIKTGFIYDKNYASADWFKSCMAGKFYTSQPFSADGNQDASGTFVEEVHIDDDVKQAFPDDSGMTLGYSAPVKDASGKVIAVWTNRAKFSLVEDFLVASYQDIKDRTGADVEQCIINGDGVMIAKYFPLQAGTAEFQHDFDESIFKLNLREEGHGGARALADNVRGSLFNVDPIDGGNDAMGYAHLVGALGYPGMNWGVIVSSPRKVYCAAVTTTKREIIFVLGLSVIAIVALGWLIGVRVARPLRLLAHAASVMSHGDFTQVLQHSSSKDEIGLMNESFIEMKGNTQRLIQQVAVAATHVASSSEELSAGAEETSRAVQHVSVTVQQVADGSRETTVNVGIAQASLEQNAKAISAVSRDVEEVAAFASEATQKGVAGRQRADQAMEIINRAARSVQETTEVVEALGDKTRQINSFIDIITGIADQTNLLALNAAIEAARAGDAGRGFAVVAEEVRKLAEESNTAAGSITRLVNGIEAEMEAALSAMGRSDTEVRQGVGAVSEAGSALAEIARGVESLSDRAQNISAAIEQLNAGTSEVLHTIHSLAAVAEQNSASAEEVSSAAQQQTATMEEVGASAQQLSKLAQDMQTLICQFKV